MRCYSYNRTSNDQNQTNVISTFLTTAKLFFEFQKPIFRKIWIIFHYIKNSKIDIFYLDFYWWKPYFLQCTNKKEVSSPRLLLIFLKNSCPNNELGPKSETQQDFQVLMNFIWFSSSLPLLLLMCHLKDWYKEVYSYLN